MANWQMKIELGDFWHKYPDELSLQEVAQKLVERLNGAKTEVAKRFPGYLDEFIECIENLEPFAEDPDSNVDSFDFVLEDLYDWADTKLDDEWNGKKLCWINTFGNGNTQ